jgi:hypothetical protein
LVRGWPCLAYGRASPCPEALTRDDIVEETAKSLSVQLDGVAKLWEGQQGACDRLSEILGLTPPKKEKAVLGSTWWAPTTPTLSPQQRKALLVWLNSSPALLLYFGRRVATRSAWMQMKKPAWAAMPVLDRGRERQQGEGKPSFGRWRVLDHAPRQNRKCDGARP